MMVSRTLGGHARKEVVVVVKEGDIHDGES